MAKKDSLIRRKKLYRDWMLDHPVLKFTLENLWALLVCTISAFIFAFGFKLFMNPGLEVDGKMLETIVSGGASGISQVIVLICKVCGWRTINESLALSILYFVVNIPIMALAFIGIGRRFAIYTIINIVEVSLFTALIDPTNVELFAEIARFVSINATLLGRVLFAGICTGLSSSLVYLIDASGGGVDIIAFYIGLKRKTLVGKYSLYANSITLCCFTVFDCINLLQSSSNPTSDVAVVISKVFFSILYMVIVTLVVDTVNNKNQKIKVEVVTDNPNFGKELVVAMPHACTETTATGVFSGKNKYVFTMVVLRYELKDMISFIKEIDPSAFVQVVPLESIYGRFHTKSVR